MARGTRKSVATVWIESGRIHIRADYNPQWVEMFKQHIQPGHRSWEPMKKVWTADPSHIDDVEELCNRFYDEVNVLQDQGGDAAPAAVQDGGASALHQLIQHAKPETMEKIYKLVMRDVHPDMGGSTEKAQTVTVAWNKIKPTLGGV
jgi:hypothetical protein